MTTTLLATVGHGSTALWYLTRATGLVALLLLSATLVLGTVASVGWTAARWPRFLTQSVHRNLSLFCLALIGVHVLSTVGDGYVPIGLADAVIPFRSLYRPIWVGLGALAFDMLLAVAITSGLRRRIGVRLWRSVHWLAYACWPVAVVHGLGSGSDSRLPGAQVVFVMCVGSVAVAVAWRLVLGRARSVVWRIGGALAGVATLVLIAAFAAAGPLRPGWSHRAGTAPELLAQLSGASSASYAAKAPSTSTTTAPAATSDLPAVPFSTSASGTVATSSQKVDGEFEVALVLHLQDASVPLLVQIMGPAVNGGVAMRYSDVSFGSFSGRVTALDGSYIGAIVSGPTGSLSLSMQLVLDPAARSVTGQVAGSAAP